jgi:diguanylate cyclase (GGDEF)-like protein
VSREPQSHRRVLVVDDDPTMRLLVREALIPDGHTVIEAPDGEAALRAFADSGPDLVLLDVQMPGIDGFEVCSRLRSRPDAEHTPVVMMTGLDDLDSIQRAYDTGATDFITKPLNWLILRHRVRYLLRASATLKELRTSEEGLANAQRLARLGSWRMLPGSRAVDGSREYRAILELPEDDKPVDSARVLERVHPEDRSDVERTVRECLEHRKALRIDFRIVLPDGSEKILHAEGQLSEGESGTPGVLEGTIQDVTERKRAEEQIRFLAYHDSLTGLGNRRLFNERLTLAIAQARRDESLIGVLYLDLDHFKRINDTLGHSVGDALLQNVADRVVSCIRETDFVARQELGSAVSRLGGDEFTVLLTDVHDVTGLAKVARRILKSLESPFSLEDHEVVISGSIGITTWPSDGNDAETLLRNADTAMYHVKERGRNGHQFFAQSMNEIALRGLVLEGKLRRGLEQHEFELHYQPKVSLRSGEVVGLEALARWRDPSEGLISPGEFIPIAEETGLIEPLGEWVLGEACAQIVRWRDAGWAPVPVSVNLSAQQFRGGDLVARFTRIIEESGADPRCLEMEITESILLQDEKAVSADLHRLRERGIQISVDDFGTGYSSFAYLRRLPVDAIKIDRSFVMQIATEPDDAALTAAIVSMGKALRLRVVAEGVEDHEQRELLVAWGCDEMQGFLHSRPLPADQVTRHFRRVRSGR